MDDLKPLGQMLTDRLIAALGRDGIDAYGKSGMVGAAGRGGTRGAVACAVWLCDARTSGRKSDHRTVVHEGRGTRGQP